MSRGEVDRLVGDLHLDPACRAASRAGVRSSVDSWRPGRGQREVKELVEFPEELGGARLSERLVRPEQPFDDVVDTDVVRRQSPGELSRTSLRKLSSS